MLAFVDERTILLERQFRYPLRRHFIELPAGKIDKGDAVLIADEDGQEIARGLVRYDTAHEGRICGLKSDAIEAAIGFTSGPMVHADDLAVAQAHEPEFAARAKGA